MTSRLHAERLAAVVEAVRASGARSVLDLGCGDGDLVLRLRAVPGLARILALDLDRAALERLKDRLAAAEAAGARVELVQGSVLEAGDALAGFDCAVMVESLEHIAPEQLSVLERAVFARMRPATVVLTTPNAEYNAVLGVPARRFRHPGHRFEWDRPRFRAWAEGVARRTGYGVTCTDIAGRHPERGGASQMAVFARGVPKAAPPADGP